MPFLLHRPDTNEPSTLMENDVQRVIKADFPDPAIQDNVWSKLRKGEKVFVHQGQLEWTRDATV